MRELGVGDLLDGYRVEARLARGGMASIFRAVDEATGERVVLKVPHLQYEADVVFFERFRQEEAIALQLEHPHLVRALRPPREKTRVYLVMEYVGGSPLSELLAARGALPRAEAVALARQLCEALHYLHAHGVVHRDVKPGNVVVSEGEVKLLDFGIAHVETARRLTVAGLSASIGTPDYMAPEQLRGGGGDARADLFALGTMLYLMLSGRLPYEGGDWEARMDAKRLEEPTPLSSLLPGVDPGLEAVVMRAIEPDLARRYATAADLLADLRDPSGAAPQGPARAPGRPRRRLDVRFAAAIVTIAAALALVGAVAWVGFHRGVDAGPPGATAPRPAARAPARP